VRDCTAIASLPVRWKQIKEAREAQDGRRLPDRPVLPGFDAVPPGAPKTK